MNVKLSTLEGQTFNLTFENDITVQAIRQKLQKEHNFNTDRCYFCHNGKILGTERLPKETFSDVNNSKPIIIFNSRIYPDKSYPKVDNAFNYNFSRYSDSFVSTESSINKVQPNGLPSHWTAFLPPDLPLPEVLRMGVIPDRNQPHLFRFVSNRNQSPNRNRHNRNNSESDDEDIDRNINQPQNARVITIHGNTGQSNARGLLDLISQSNGGIQANNTIVITNGNQRIFLRSQQQQEQEEQEQEQEQIQPMRFSFGNINNNRQNATQNQVDRNAELARRDAELNQQIIEGLNLNITLNENENQAVSRLARNGYDRATVIQVFEACDRNEEAAMNLLVTMG